MTYEEIIQEIEFSRILFKDLNYINIKCNLLTPNEENADKFNTVLAYCKENNFHQILRTKSGGIKHVINRVPAYSYTYSNSGAEILLFTVNGWSRIQFRTKIAVNEETDKAMSGRKAFNNFKAILSANGIDIEKYATENGLEAKQQIEKPLIKMESDRFISSEMGKGYTNCHHIDFHNSYPAGLANKHPEFRDVLTMMYNKRKENPIYKAILNYSIGFMQSQWVNFKYAELSRDAINDNNARVKALAEILKATGRQVMAYNTDGIWYRGEIYHGEGEGDNLGEWHNDHINCRLRFKSAGSYEFIEDGQYHPVVRGYTLMDRTKSREDWEWGDIYHAPTIIFTMDDNGIHFRTI